MPSLREDITKTFRRLGRRERTIQASRAETVLATGPREGKDFGSYRVLRQLGSGGMGQVYLALDTRLGRHVALKFLDDRLLTDPTMLDRLYQEARTASSLNHPNILTIYEIGEAAGEHFIASEYVEGITVGDAIDRKLITPKLAVDIATQVSSALVAAHSAGIIHRDLKATNIMVRPDGLVKVIDFGLAKRSEERLAAAAAAGEHQHTVSTPGGLAGTVEYMSPEQARGDVVDHRTDLWSLGVVFYEMLAGKYPFRGPTEGHVIVAILDQPVTAIENASSLPRGVTGIVDKALTKDRTKRYQSAGEMLRDMQSLGVSKQRISAVKRFGVLAESKQLGRIAMSVAAFVALASAFAIWWFAFDGKERVLGPQWFEPGPAEQVTFNGKVDFATISPDGKYLAYTSRENGKGILHIRNLTAKTEWQMPPYSETTFGLTFGPGSRTLYYVLHDLREWGRLYSVDVNGGIPKMLVDDIDGPITFSPDGKRFAFVRRFEDKQTSANKIIVADVDDTKNQREIVRKVGTQIIPQLAWSERNDIAAVVFSYGMHSSGRGGLFIFDQDGSMRRSPISDTTMRTMTSPAWISGTDIVTFAGIPDWRTGRQKGLYEVSAQRGEFREYPSPPFIDGLSVTRKGYELAAIQQTRTASFWWAAKESLDSPRQIVPAENIDTSSVDRFSWDEQDNLILASALPRSVSLVRLSLTGKTERLTKEEGCVERKPAYTTAKSLLIYVSNCAAGGNEWNIWSFDTRTGQSKSLTRGMERDDEPDVSRDGRWIVYTAWPSDVSSLWKLPLEGGTPQQISHIQAGEPAISPDGKSVLCQIRESYDGRYRYAILSLSTGNIQQQFWDLPYSDVWPRWEPDGRAFDFLDAKRTRVWRKMLDGGPATPLIPRTADRITAFSWNQQGNKLAFTTVHTNDDVVLFHRKVNRQRGS